MNLHKAIVLSSNHRRLIKQYSLIEHQVRLYIQSSDALVLNPDKIVEQHDPIVRALLQGEVDAAVDFAAKHNELEGAILVEHLQQTEQN